MISEVTMPSQGREAGRGIASTISLVMVLALSAPGCASRGTAVRAAQAEDGTYDFFARVGERTELRGSLFVVAGTHMLQAESGTCREDLLVVRVETNRYICDHTSDVEDLVFVIDKRFPLSRSVWTGKVRERKQRTVCAQYAIQNGRQVCVRTTVESYEVTTQLRGPLTFRPRPVS